MFENRDPIFFGLPEFASFRCVRMFTTIPTKEYAKEKTKTSNIPVGRAGVWKLPTKWFPLGGGSAIYCNYRVTWIGFWSSMGAVANSGLSLVILCEV